MIQVQQTKTYAKWFSELRDRTARARTNIRIRRGVIVIVLLAGGDESTQDKDIRNAKALAKDLKE